MYTISAVFLKMSFYIVILKKNNCIKIFFVFIVYRYS